jgi:hypothetical protein
VLERHTQVDAILGALEIEKEAFHRAQLFSWIFFPLWIIMAIVQAVCFVLSNGQFHPLAKILEDCGGSDEGKCFLIVKFPYIPTCVLKAKSCLIFMTFFLFFNLNLKYLLLKLIFRGYSHQE